MPSCSSMVRVQSGHGSFGGNADPARVRYGGCESPHHEPLGNPVPCSALEVKRGRASHPPERPMRCRLAVASAGTSRLPKITPKNRLRGNAAAFTRTSAEQKFPNTTLALRLNSVVTAAGQARTRLRSAKKTSEFARIFLAGCCRLGEAHQNPIPRHKSLRTVTRKQSSRFPSTGRFGESS